MTTNPPLVRDLSMAEMEERIRTRPNFPSNVYAYDMQDRLLVPGKWYRTVIPSYETALKWHKLFRFDDKQTLNKIIDVCPLGSRKLVFFVGFSEAGRGLGILYRLGHLEYFGYGYAYHIGLEPVDLEKEAQLEKAEGHGNG